MKTRTLTMMLTLLVAGLVIGCSSAPEAPATPATSVPNLSEKEAIGIARSNTQHTCWVTKEPGYASEQKISDFTHTETASFQQSGVWVVTANTSWNIHETLRFSDKTVKRLIPVEWPCTYVVDDATGKVTSN